MLGIRPLAVALLVLGLGVGACSAYRDSNAIAALPADQLAARSDEDICQGRLFNPRHPELAGEAERRGLGDCSANHFRCVAEGTAYATAAYAACRQRHASVQTRPAVTGQNYQPVQTFPPPRRCIEIEGRSVCF